MDWTDDIIDLVSELPWEFIVTFLLGMLVGGFGVWWYL